jgi:transcriptional regulator with XRE-family HTH domain
MISTTTIGQRVAMIRVHRMVTQAELAAAIGVSRSMMHLIEYGHTRIRLDMAKRLAAALHCTVGDLLLPLDTPMPRVRLRRRSKRALSEQASVPLASPQGEKLETARKSSVEKLLGSPLVRRRAPLW